MHPNSSPGKTKAATSRRSRRLRSCRDNSPQRESDTMKRILTPLLFGIVSAAAGSAAADSITFYQDDNYRGRNFTGDQPVTNFASNGFNDRVHSAVVHEGRWEICVDAD